MTRAEAREWLHKLKWLLADQGSALAGVVEDAERVLDYGFTSEQFREYVHIAVLPPGRRGHVRLVLNSPYNARVYALVAGILRAL